MNIKLGTLQFVPAKDHPELVAPSVALVISKLADNDKIGAVEIDPNLSDTAVFCDAYKVDMDHVANCVVLEAKRADKTWFAGCLILASTKADVNGLTRRTLDARKVSFAPMEKAVSETEMEYGGITPVGLPENWSLLVDKDVADTDYVIIGSGIRKSKLALPGNFFASLPNVKILEDLGQQKTV